jgi:hypothetical protein
VHFNDSGNEPLIKRGNMKLSLEIPTSYLIDWSPLCDFDFALAHRVLEDEKYAEFFADRPKGRELILDNSMHELGGVPMAAVELGEAAKRCRADYVCAPDQLGQMKKNYAWFVETHRLLGNQFMIATVLTGNDFIERNWFLANVRQASLMCLAFRTPRFDWFLEHNEQLRRWARIHLFGVNDLYELIRFRHYSAWKWSVDTGKPIKWGVQKEHLDRKDGVRGAPLPSLDLLSVRNLNCAQTEAVLWNIAYLRRFTEGP